MFRGPGVVRRRPLLRAAVVGGGAYAAGRAAARRQDAAAVPSQASGSSPMMAQLDQLAALHQQGALTDEEFAAAKARLLGT